MLGRQSVDRIWNIRFYESCLILLRAIPSPRPSPIVVQIIREFSWWERGAEAGSLTTPDWKSGVNSKLAN
ncbi:MAG: hypothetical protein KDD67_11255 [Ignavibacteriae bacterium]|nr:hypothetical protein [Ignavibacteriota bacterium]MCB9215865.1 hypothetical protein [Ignavibacteria bacterium]